MAVNQGAGRPVYNPGGGMDTYWNQQMGTTGRSDAPTNTAPTDWQEVINTDPNLQRITDPEARTNYLRAVWGLSNAYKIDNGGNIVDSHGFVARNLWWIGPAAIVGGSAIAAAAGGGGGGAAAGGAGSAGGGTLAASTAPTAAGIGATAPTVAAGTASAGVGGGSGLLAASTAPTAAGIGATTPSVTSGAVEGANTAGGGSSLLSQSRTSRLADLFGGASDKMANARTNGDLAAQRQYQLALQAAQNQFANDQTNYENQLTAPATRANQTLRGDLQANVQDLQINRSAPTFAEGSTIPRFSVTGGLRPSAMGPNARQAGAELSRQALLKLMSGEDYPTYTAPVAPTISTGGGRLENLFGGVSTGLNLFDTARGWF